MCYRKSGHFLKIDGVVKTLHLLRHFKFAVVATYLSTTHSANFEFLEYEVFYLAIQNLGFYKFIKVEIIICEEVF